MTTEFSETFSTLVAADIETCFATLVDFEDYPSWSSPITKVAVLERDADGVGRRVEFHINIRVRTVRYVLEYSYDRPRLLEWKMVEGDIKDIRGTYLLEAEGQHTKVTCSQSVSLGFWLPGFLRRTFEQQALKQSVLEFKAGAETRAQAS